MKFGRIDDILQNVTHLLLKEQMNYSCFSDRSLATCRLLVKSIHPDQRAEWSIIHHTCEIEQLIYHTREILSLVAMATINVNTHRSQDDGACVLEWQLGGETVHRVLIDPVHG